MKQSDMRAAGRGIPASFGREPEAEREDESFRVQGGMAFMTLSLEVVPSATSLEALYEQVKDTVSRAIRDAYAETIGEPLAEPPLGGDGGAPSG